MTKLKAVKLTLAVHCALLTVHCVLLTNYALAAGDFIWGHTSDPAPSYGYYSAVVKAVAVDASGIYAVGSEAGTGSGRIEKRSLTDGNLITSFGTAGAITIPNDIFSRIAVDSTDIYIASSRFPWSTPAWRIQKRDSTGNLITSFGASGVVTEPLLSPAITAIAVDSTGVYAGGYEMVAGYYQWRIEKRSKSTGALDSSFGTGGVVSSNSGPYSEYLYTIAIDSTYIYAAGTDYSGTDIRWRIEKRSKTTGALDPSFGTGGVVTSNPTTGSDYLNAIVVDSTGVYAAGSGGEGWRIEKRDLTTGTLVWAQTETLAVCGSDAAYAITLDSSGVYLAGYDQVTDGYLNTEWRIEKRDKTTGNIIWAQSIDQYPYTNAFENDEAVAIAIDLGGVYVAGGGNPSEWRIEKRTLDGGSPPSPPPSGGAIIWEQNSFPEASATYPSSIALDSSGVFVSSSTYIEKRDLTTGLPVTSFGGGGAISGGSFINAMAVDSTGLYVADYYADVSSDYVWRIRKRDKTTGSLISSFGTAGEVIINPTVAPFQDEQPMDLAADSTGVYVVGYDQPVLGDFRWRIEKRNITNGSPVSSFGSAGVVTSNPGLLDDRPYAIAIDTGSMYIAGVDSSLGNNQWRIEKRDLTTGALDPSFGTGGVVTSNPSSDSDIPYAIAVDSTSIYVAGFAYVGPLAWSVNNQWRIEKRDKTTGWLVTSFGTSGAATTNLSTGDERAQGIAVDSSGVYIAGFDKPLGYFWTSIPASSRWRVEKRDLTTGNIIWEQTYRYQPDVCRADRAHAIAVNTTGLYMSGAYDGGSRLRIEKRDFSSAPPSFIDCGFRVFDGTSTVTIACEPLGTPTSPLRISKGGNIYGIALVDTTDTNASRVRIQTSTGVKSLRRYP